MLLNADVTIQQMENGWIVKPAGFPTEIRPAKLDSFVFNDWRDMVAFLREHYEISATDPA